MARQAIHWHGVLTGTVCTFDVDWRCLVEEAYDEGTFVANRRALWYSDGSPHSVHRDGVETTWFSDGSPQSMSFDDSGVVFNIITQFDGSVCSVVLNDPRRGAEIASSLSLRRFDRTVSFTGRGVDVSFIQMVSRCQGIKHVTSIELYDTVVDDMPLFLRMAFPRNRVSIFSRPKATWE